MPSKFAFAKVGNKTIIPAIEETNDMINPIRRIRNMQKVSSPMHLRSSRSLGLSESTAPPPRPPRPSPPHPTPTLNLQLKTSSHEVMRRPTPSNQWPSIIRLLQWDIIC